MTSPNIPCVLTIAGTDPCGAAGIQVDLRVFADHGCYGLSVISAVVWQNTQGVRGWRACSAEEVRQQMLAVLDDLPVHAIKLGMLATAEIVEAVAEVVRTHPGAQGVPVVCDPVLASGDGQVALAKEALVEAMHTHLFGVVDVLTPNIPEAGVLLGGAFDDSMNSSIDDPIKAAQVLAQQVRGGVLLKGGHWGDADEAVDWWAHRGQVTALRGYPRIPEDVRGTGCQLASAIASNIALGDDLGLAIDNARDYLHWLLVNARQRLGRGRPVIVHVP